MMTGTGQHSEKRKSVAEIPTRRASLAAGGGGTNTRSSTTSNLYKHEVQDITTATDSLLNKVSISYFILLLLFFCFRNLKKIGKKMLSIFYFLFFVSFFWNILNFLPRN